MSIKWEDPGGPTKGGRTDYSEIVKALRENPGRWALIKTDAPASTVQHLKRLYGVEAVSRELKNGRGKIYARWNGED